MHLLDVNVSERCILVTLDTTIYRQLNEWIKGTADISEGITTTHDVFKQFNYESRYITGKSNYE